MFKLDFSKQVIDWINTGEIHNMSLEQSMELFLIIFTLLSLLAQNGFSKFMEGRPVNSGEACAGLTLEAIRALNSAYPGSTLDVILKEFGDAAIKNLEENKFDELLNKSTGMEC